VELGSLCVQWADLADMKVVPVYDDEEAAKALA